MGRSATSIWWTETRDAAKYPTMRMTGPQRQNTWLRCQRCWGWEKLLQGKAEFPFLFLHWVPVCHGNDLIKCSQTVDGFTWPAVSSILLNWTYYFLISLSSSPVYSATDQSILTHVPPKKILLIFHFEFDLWNQSVINFSKQNPFLVFVLSNFTHALSPSSISFHLKVKSK